MKKEQEEKYLKEFDEIYQKYPINKSDIEYIKQVCENELPKVRIKNSEKVDFCLKQKEFAKYLFQKLLTQLEKYHMYKDDYEGRMVIMGEEENYTHSFNPSEKIPKSIYDKYYNRSNEGKKMVDELMNKLMKIHYYFYSETSKQIKGNQGEDIVKKYFSMFSEKYPSRMNVILPIEDEFAKTSELDSVIVTPKGIFVCEIKNWGNEKDCLYVNNDDTWYIRKNGVKEKQKNPFEQNIRHVIALEKYLKKKNISCKIIPIVVIADNKTRIINESHKAVLKSSSVYEYIENQPLPMTINEDKQKEILNLLDNLGTEENSFPCKDLLSMEEEYEEAIYKVLKLRETEFQLEQELFKKCEDIIKKDNNSRQKKWIIFFIILAILVVIGIFVFRDVIKFMIGVAILGIVCGGLDS